MKAMTITESSLLNDFLRKNKNANGLDLIIVIADDEWAEDKGFQIMEKQDNGHVWQCWATDILTVKDYIQVD